MTMKWRENDKEKEREREKGTKEMGQNGIKEKKEEKEKSGEKW
jgi:hypothetical protein